MKLKSKMARVSVSRFLRGKSHSSKAAEPPSNQIMTPKKVKRPTPAFLSKLYTIVNTSAPLCKWGPDGTSFIINDSATFAKEVLSKYFKSGNFQSFVRQLHFYNFRKLDKAKKVWEFRHEMFLRGQPDLLYSIRRKTCADYKDEKTSAAVAIEENRAMMVTIFRVARHLKEEGLYRQLPLDLQADLARWSSGSGGATSANSSAISSASASSGSGGNGCHAAASPIGGSGANGGGGGGGSNSSSSSNPTRNRSRAATDDAAAGLSALFAASSEASGGPPRDVRLRRHGHAVGPHRQLLPLPLRRRHNLRLRRRLRLERGRGLRRRCGGLLSMLLPW